MDYRKRITIDPTVMLGKPIIKGTRITVELILRKLAQGLSVDDLLSAYPHLTKDDIYATLSYSADVISREEVIEA